MYPECIVWLLLDSVSDFVAAAVLLLGLCIHVQVWWDSEGGSQCGLKPQKQPPLLWRSAELWKAVLATNSAISAPAKGALCLSRGP